MKILYSVEYRAVLTALFFWVTDPKKAPRKGCFSYLDTMAVTQGFFEVLKMA